MRQSGLTMIEIMVVLVIVGVLTSVAVSAYGKNQKIVSASSILTSLDGLKASMSSYYQENPGITVLPSLANLGYSFPTTTFTSVGFSVLTSPLALQIKAVVNSAALGLPVALTYYYVGCLNPGGTADNIQNQTIRWACLVTTSDMEYVPKTCQQDYTANVGTVCN